MFGSDKASSDSAWERTGLCEAMSRCTVLSAAAKVGKVPHVDIDEARGT